MLLRVAGLVFLVCRLLRLGLDMKYEKTTFSLLQSNEQGIENDDDYEFIDKFLLLQHTETRASQEISFHFHKRRLGELYEYYLRHSFKGIASYRFRMSVFAPLLP